MAEVLGLVASGLSVAQVAGSILTNSLKLKALLDEVKDAPKSLRDTLDDLELLTPILSEFADDDGEIATTPMSTQPSTLSHLQPGLQKAFAACRKAAEQLELLVTEMKSEIESARGGLRRKRALVKVVLKRSAFAKHELRLQKAIQLVMMAQNTYIIALQRTQPEIIVSQVVLALTQPSQSSQGHYNTPEHRAPSKYHVITKKLDHQAPANQTLSPLQKYTQLGNNTNVIGIVRMQSWSKQEDRQSKGSGQGTCLRIQLHLPPWLSAAVFEASISRSYAGWTCSLNVYGNILQQSEEFNLVIEAILTDNVDAMYHLFQERRCGPMDHLVLTKRWRANESSMLEKWALSYDAWRVAEYLLSHGAEHGAAFRHEGSNVTRTNRQSERHRERILKHVMLSDAVRISCLVSCPDDMNSFTSLISRVWPAAAFYDAASENQRLGLAMKLVQECGRKEPLLSPSIFQHLCGTLALEDADIGAVKMVSSCLTQGLGQIVWRDPVLGGTWHQAIWDTALRLNKTFLMPEQQLYDCEIFPDYHFAMLFDRATPFTNLFLESMVVLPGSSENLTRARQHKITYRLKKCERALHVWLEIMRHCGIDLVDYGDQTKRILHKRGDYNFNIFRDVWFEREGLGTNNGLFEVRLIGVKYGSQPGDWKLWWSEPTDELVGDFWREMEPEPLYIPGSWVED